MSYIKVVVILLIAWILAFGGYCVGYNNAHTRDFEAACLLMDCLRNMMDSEEIGSEVEESFHEWFDDLECGIYNTSKLTDIKQLDEYYWCY